MTLTLTRAANENNARLRPARRAPTRHFVVDDCKVAYVCNPEASSTTVKWLVAALAQIDPDRFARSAGVATTRRETVHDNRRWGSVVRPRAAADAELARIGADDDWFVFTVVRRPHERVWAAWRSRVLCGHPKVLADADKRRWVPAVPRKRAEVVDAFAEFAAALAAGSAGAIARDPYFIPQTETVGRRGLRYTQVYDVADLERLRADLHTHLERRGVAREVPLRHGPRPAFGFSAGVLANGAADFIESAYASDLDVFGARWHGVPMGDEGDWDAAAYNALGFVRGANERIADLSETVRALGRRDNGSR